MKTGRGVVDPEHGKNIFEREKTYSYTGTTMPIHDNVTQNVKKNPGVSTRVKKYIIRTICFLMKVLLFIQIYLYPFVYHIFFAFDFIFLQLEIFF